MRLCAAAAQPPQAAAVQVMVLRADIDGKQLVSQQALDQLVTQLEQLETGVTLSRVQYSHFSKIMVEHKAVISTQNDMSTKIITADPNNESNQSESNFYQCCECELWG